MLKEVQIPEGKMVIHREEQQIQKFEQLAKQLEESATKALDEYQLLGLGEITLQQLQACITGDAETFIRERVSGNKPVVLGGLVLAADKVKEMIEIPSLASFKASLIILKNRLRELQSHSGLSLADCSIINDQVVIDQEAAASWISGRCQYANTEAEKECWLAIQKIAEDVKALYEKHRIVILPETSSILKHHFESYHGSDPQVRIEINPYLFKKHFNPGIY